MHFSFSAGVVYNSKILFSDNYLNGLFEVEINSGYVRYITFFPEEERTISLLHKKAFLYKDSIIFSPNQGRHVHIYDVNTGMIKAIPIYKKNDSRYIFTDALLDNNTLYIIPGTAEQPIVALNLDDFSSRIIKHKLDDIIGEHIPYDLHFYRAIYYDNAFWITSNNSNKVYRVNDKSEETEAYDTPVDNLAGIYMVDGNIVLTTLYGGIYTWDYIKNSCYEHKKENVSKYLVYSVLENDEGSVFFVPDADGKLYITKDYSNRLVLEDKIKIDIKSEHNIRVLGHTRDSACLYDGGVVIYPTYEGDLVVVLDGKAKTIKQKLENKRSYFCSNSSVLYKKFDKKPLIEEKPVSLSDLCILLETSNEE